MSTHDEVLIDSKSCVLKAFNMVTPTVSELKVFSTLLRIHAVEISPTGGHLTFFLDF